VRLVFVFYIKWPYRLSKGPHGYRSFCTCDLIAVAKQIAHRYVVTNGQLLGWVGECERVLMYRHGRYGRRCNQGQMSFGYWHQGGWPMQKRRRNRPLQKRCLMDGMTLFQRLCVTLHLFGTSDFVRRKSRVEINNIGALMLFHLASAVPHKFLRHGAII